MKRLIKKILLQETFGRDRWDAEYSDEYPKYKDMLITAIKMDITASGKSETSIMLGNSNGDVLIDFRIGSKTLYYDYNWSEDIEKLIPWHIYVRHFKYALADCFSDTFPDVIIKDVTGAHIASY
jgi:hypothetical protein